LLTPVSLLAVHGDKAQYVGGTVPGVSDKAEGSFGTTHETAIHFTSRKGNVVIPYANLTSLEYENWAKYQRRQTETPGNRTSGHVIKPAKVTRKDAKQ